MTEQDYFIGSVWQGGIVIRDYDPTTRTVNEETVKVEDLRPVTVTKGVLKSIGFEEVDDRILGIKRHEAFINGKYHLELTDEWSNSIDRSWSVHFDNEDFCTIGSGDFEYLHQLQLLFYAVTGEPLVIDPSKINREGL